MLVLVDGLVQMAHEPGATKRFDVLVTADGLDGVLSVVRDPEEGCTTYYISPPRAHSPDRVVLYHWINSRGDRLEAWLGQTDVHAAREATNPDLAPVIDALRQAAVQSAFSAHEWNLPTAGDLFDDNFA